MKRTGAAAAPLAFALLLGGCHKQTQQISSPSPPPVAPARVPAAAADKRPLAAPPSGRSPEVKGRPDIVETGLASWYGPPYHNRAGADGTIYDQNAMTAAHRTLPMGSIVRVTNLANQQSVVVRITDRGPFVAGRILDLSLAAAKATGVYRAGVAQVRLEAYTLPLRLGVDPGGRWCVQIGAFSTADDAVQLKNDLLRRYANARVIEFAGPTGFWVRINPRQPDRAHADQIAASIHVPDAEPFVVRTD